MLALRYLTPFGFLALIPLGAWLGGAWTFLAAGATPLCLISLDSVLGEDETSTQSARGARWLPRLYVILQLAMTGWAAAWIARPTTGLIEFAGLAISIGLTTGVFGFVAAHELIHSRDRGERALGLALLATVLYMHFRIAHVYGHHRRAATIEDPASAQLGEGLYAFIARSVAGQLREAWAFEAQRQRQLGRAAIRPANRMVAYFVIELALLFGIALLSLGALAFVIAVAVIAIALLESFNYVAHYGLSRRIGADGRAERLNPHHSWNSGRRMNNAALFNMGRHSDHHRHTIRSFERLEPLSEAPELPGGYASALVMAVVPPLWRSVMDSRAKAVIARHDHGLMQAGSKARSDNS